MSVTGYVYDLLAYTRYMGQFRHLAKGQGHSDLHTQQQQQIQVTQVTGTCQVICVTVILTGARYQ